jgi:8-oxo-dGTP diphosphatase
MPSTERKFVPIVAGCLSNDRGEFLICQRPAHKSYPGEWEFPGGKLERGESSQDALKRELHEELGIQVTACRPLIRSRHAYPELAVELDTWLVSSFDGQVRSSEHPAIAWVRADELPQWKLLAADRPIVTALRLPACYAFTPPEADTGWILQRLDSLPPHTLLRLRRPGLPDTDYEMLARRLLPHCRTRNLPLMLDRDPAMVARVGAAGWHAPASCLQVLPARPLPPEYWTAASCHHADELERARSLGFDFAVLGTVLKTATHPAQAGMGWPGFSALAQGASIPVYAIGGLQTDLLMEAQAHGAQGIAGISAFWTAY